MNVTEQSGESHIDIPESHQLPGPRPVGEGTFWEGRSGLIMPAILTAFSLYLLIGVFKHGCGQCIVPRTSILPNNPRHRGFVGGGGVDHSNHQVPHASGERVGPKLEIPL